MAVNLSAMLLKAFGFVAKDKKIKDNVRINKKRSPFI